MEKAQMAAAGDVFSGGTLQRLRDNNWDIGKALRTNATLPRDAWVEVDKTVIEVAQTRLAGIADLQFHGLVRNLGGIGVMYDFWPTLSDSGDAEQSMSGMAPGAENATAYGESGIPIPITFADFRIPARKLAAMERYGTPLDVTAISGATRKVVEKLEEALFIGSTVVAGGLTLPGYLNYPDANAVSLTGNWGTHPANIEKDVVKLIVANENARHYGPYMLYVHADEWAALRQRDSNADRTYHDIVLAMPGILGVRPVSVLPDGNICLVEMSAETVDLAVGVDIMVGEWETHGGRQANFTVMAAIAARLKSDFDKRCGIAHDTTLT